MPQGRTARSVRTPVATWPGMHPAATWPGMHPAGNAVGGISAYARQSHCGDACLARAGTPTGGEPDVSRRGWVLFTTMSVIWGVPYLLIKIAVGGVPVPVLVLARVTIGAALLLPVALRRRELRVLLPYWRWLVVFAVVEIISPWFLLSEAELKLSSSMSGLLIASVPIIGALLARFTGDAERLTVIRWAGLLAGLAGVALLVGPDRK